MSALLASVRKYFEALSPELRLRLQRDSPPLLLLLLVLLVFKGCIQPVQYRAKEELSKQNLYAVQLALEHFAVDAPDGAYPDSIAQLEKTGYISVLPTNPFSCKPMKACQLGQLPPPGDFVYQPQYSPGSPHPTGYSLGSGKAALQLKPEE